MRTVVQGWPGETHQRPSGQSSTDPPQAVPSTYSGQIKVQLSVRDVARLFNVAEQAVYHWISQGKIPFHHVNRQYRFNRAELLEWATAHRLDLSAHALAEGLRATPGSVAIARALEEGGVFHDVEGTDKQSVIEALMDRLALPEEVDSDLLLHMLLARKAFVMAGDGQGVAIPGLRSPIVLNVAQPILVLLFLARPVALDAGHGAPVRALFTLVSPSTRVHLHLLSRLPLAIRHPAVREVLAKQAPREAILAALRAAETAGTDPIRTV